jgi:CBS domain-containing protein
MATMTARDLMTTAVVAVTPDTSTRTIARLLVDHGISAVPVIDANGAPLGMVSEGDLVGRSEPDRENRRDWWLALLAEGEAIHPDFLASLDRADVIARDVMAAPVVTVVETTPAPEIARILATYRIKRVPVLREGRVVGIVSRADLLRAIAAESTLEAGTKSATPAHDFLSAAIANLDQRFLHHRHDQADPEAHPTPPIAESGFSAADFRGLVGDHKHRESERRDEAARQATAQRSAQVKEFITEHIADENWRSLLHAAREAAERGDSEFLLLRFPSDLCSDGGRAINAPQPNWPATLRGEAAEIYLRWARELAPRGFRLTARVLNFPGGFPGDIGLFLGWGE